VRSDGFKPHRKKAPTGDKDMTDQQWTEAGDQVAEVLARLHGPGRARFEQEARRRGCSLEELAAAAVIGALRDFMDGLDVPGDQTP
jgi:hypothetical protein